MINDGNGWISHKERRHWAWSGITASMISEDWWDSGYEKTQGVTMEVRDLSGEDKEDHWVSGIFRTKEF